MPKLEQREHGWYDYNYVMDRDGQVLFQTKNNRWIIRGIKMTRAQIKREIKQQILDIERRQQAKN
jgi:retron-type reverse transcriptase